MGKEKEYSYLMIYGTGRLLAGDNELDDRDAREEQDRRYHHGVFLHSVPPFYRKETTRIVKNWVDGAGSRVMVPGFQSEPRHSQLRVSLNRKQPPRKYAMGMVQRGYATRKYAPAHSRTSRAPGVSLPNAAMNATPYTRAVTER